MTMVTSRLVVAVMSASLFLVPACVQPGSIDDPAADAAPGSPNQPDADINNPPPPGQPDAAPQQGGNSSFATDVYPLLQANSLGCANCHTSGGQASFLPYNDGAAAVYGRLMTGTQRVNTASPETSLILEKPLTGSPVSHRVKPFQSTAGTPPIRKKAGPIPGTSASQAGCTGTWGVPQHGGTRRPHSRPYARA